MNTRKLNALWSNVIRALFGGKCAVCGKDGTDAHHLIKRNTCALKFKYHAMNGVWLCRMCHDLFENNPKGLLMFVSGIQKAWYLRNCQNKKYEDVDFVLVETELKQKLMEMNLGKST
jgi:hypothetical protein